MAENGKKPDSEPTVEDLARRLMDLWQEQMAAIAADPDLMRQMATMMAASPFPAMMQGIMQGILAATAKPTGPAGPDGRNPYEWWKGENGPKPSASTGTPAAAPASQPGGGDLAELRRNLAGLEARLAELGNPGKGEPAAKPRPKRPQRKSPKSVAGPAGGGGEGGAGGAGGGAAG